MCVYIFIYTYTYIHYWDVTIISTREIEKARENSESTVPETTVNKSYTARF